MISLTRHKNIIFMLVLILVTIILTGFAFSNYFLTRDSITVDFSKTSDEGGLIIRNNASVDSEKIVKIAISAIVSPDETIKYYQEMLDYISSKIDVKIRLVQRKTYQEVNDLLEQNKVDAALVCSKAYVEGNSQFDLELLVVPVVKEKTVYYSYIIVSKDSKINSIQDLKGLTFAYTDPLSNSGKLSPDYLLIMNGENPSTFFKLTFYTFSHDKSIQAVSEKLVDGAAVDSLVWDYMNAINPKFTSKTKIIQVSPPYGIPPIVVPKNIDPLLKTKLRNVLLEMHQDEEGKSILQRIFVDRFVEADDSIYDTIRMMTKVVNNVG